MKNPINICFQKWDSINRLEYLYTIAFLLAICVTWAMTIPFIIISIIPSSNSPLVVAYLMIPILLVFSYGIIITTYKRGKDFWASNILLYIFLGWILIKSWTPVISFLYTPYLLFILRPTMLFVGIWLNLFCFITWSIFQFTKTKNEEFK